MLNPPAPAIHWGKDQEAKAVQAYIEQSNEGVEYLGKTFFEYSSYAGGSPDGLVGEKGIIEVKCPYNPTNHTRVVLTGEVTEDHFLQCQANLIFCNRAWCDYVSFDPRMPEKSQLKIIRIYRDEETFDKIKERLYEATHELNRLLNTIN